MGEVTLQKSRLSLLVSKLASRGLDLGIRLADRGAVLVELLRADRPGVVLRAIARRGPGSPGRA